MDSTSHYREAERLLRVVRNFSPTVAAEDGPLLLQAAQVHATLALAAVTALSSTTLSPPDHEAWFFAAAADAPIAPETDDDDEPQDGE